MQCRTGWVIGYQGANMSELHRQIELFGVSETAARHPSPAGKRMVLAAARVMAEPNDDDLAFMHTGLAQTALPHAKPKSDDMIWRRSAGRFHLMVTPGAVFDEESGQARRVGVPYGSRARLIMLYLQTEGVKSREVNLGKSMSAWIRSLGLSVTGGAKGTIAPIKEQTLRISRCQFTMQWSRQSSEDGEQGTETIIEDKRIVEGLSLWESASGGNWRSTVMLSQEFHEHLREHALPLDNRAIAHLSDNSLGLDLYATLAYRLPKLNKPQQLSWAALNGQFGSELAASHHFAEKVRKVLPQVLAVYPDAKVEATRHGLVLQPSSPAVPRNRIYFGNAGRKNLLLLSGNEKKV